MASPSAHSEVLLLTNYEHTPVTVRLVNGDSINGEIIRHDSRFILLEYTKSGATDPSDRLIPFTSILEIVKVKADG